MLRNTRTKWSHLDWWGSSAWQTNEALWSLLYLQGRNVPPRPELLKQIHFRLKDCSPRAALTDDEWYDFTLPAVPQALAQGQRHSREHTVTNIGFSWFWKLLQPYFIAEEKILQITQTALQSLYFEHMGYFLEPDVTQIECAFYEQGNLGKNQSHSSKGKICNGCSIWMSHYEFRYIGFMKHLLTLKWNWVGVNQVKCSQT